MRQRLLKLQCLGFASPLHKVQTVRLNPFTRARLPLLNLNIVRGYAKKSFPDHEVILMPALSPTMEAGSLATWCKKIGDELSAGDVLATIDTDKAQMDFEMQDDGYLAKTLVEENTMNVKVGQPIAVMVSDEADVAAFADFTIEDAGSSAPKQEAVEDKKQQADEEQAKTEPEPKESKQSEPVQEKAPKKNTEATSEGSAASKDSRIIASPAARRIASEEGIALTGIKGSGPNGRIVAADVEAARGKSQSKITAGSSEVPALPAYTDKPLTNMRKTIAKRLTESYTQMPHYFLTIEANVEKLLVLRDALNQRGNDKYRISVNDMLVKACAVALKRVPEVNASFMGDFIREYNAVDISVAVATPEGLITPIVRSVDSLSLTQISQQTKDLGKRARDGKLKPEEYQGGTFTISNLGMFDIDQFTAIINPPQSCILAVGSTKPVVVADYDSSTAETPEFKVVRMMRLTMSADHRIVDGAVGARFTQQLKKILEDPIEFFV